jgi:hypothetical protein
LTKRFRSNVVVVVTARDSAPVTEVADSHLVGAELVDEPGSALPGIGVGLQRRLEQHLQVMIAELERMADGRRLAHLKLR